MIYLDNSATTVLSDNVKQDIVTNLENFGNPSSLYKIGLKTKRRIEEVREIVAKCIGGEKKYVYFTSGSACASGELEPSETLKWLNIPKEYIDGTLRFSFDLCNTTKEIDIVCNEIERIISLLSK